MRKLLLVVLVFSLLSASLASSLVEDDLKDLEIEKDIHNALEGETKVLGRHPRAIRLDKLLKYFMFVLKKASPKLRNRIMNHVRPKLRGKYRHVNPRKRTSNKIVARDEHQPGWFWSIVDILDSFGVFDYIFSRDYEDEPESKAKANPPPRKPKKKSSRPAYRT